MGSCLCLGLVWSRTLDRVEWMVFHSDHEDCLQRLYASFLSLGDRELVIVSALVSVRVSEQQGKIKKASFSKDFLVHWALGAGWIDFLNLDLPTFLQRTQIIKHSLPVYVLRWDEAVRHKQQFFTLGSVNIVATNQYSTMNKRRNVFMIKETLTLYLNLLWKRL